MSTTADSPSIALWYLIRGAFATHLIGVAVELGLPDLLHDGPRSSEDLARASGADAGALHRVLRGLSFYRIFRHNPDGRFALTELGELLRTDRPESLVDLAALTHGMVAPSLAQLTHTVKTREVAFDRVFGHDFFAHLRIDATAGERFDRNMTRVTSVVSASVVAGYDFSSIRRLVDVGGGRGHFLAAILAANPGIEGVLFDLPDVIERAAPYLQERGLLGRCSLVGGSFLDTIPPGGDAYLLSWILHDWDDATCVGVLERCRRAMGDEGRLLVVEHVFQDRGGDVTASSAEVMGALIDIDMLALLPGRERTLAEFRELFAAGGFELASATALETGVGQRTIMEALPVRR